MFLLGTQRVNEEAHLEIGGCDCVELAQTHGTPLYVVDEAELRKRCREYRSSFEQRYPDVHVAFAGKALLTMALCRLVEQEGLGLDVASGGELHTALQAGFPPARTHLHGNYKADDEIRLALTSGVSRIIVDSDPELDQINRLAAEMGKVADIAIRVSPGIKPKTHTNIQTGQVDSKFGLGIETGQAMPAIKRTSTLASLNLVGVHCHIGSQLFGLDSYARAIEMMVSFLKAVRDETGLELAELNLGGGLGIKYVEADEPPLVAEFAQVVTDALKEECAKVGLGLPRLVLEPGRSIVGEAGTTLYTAGVIKEVPQVRTYVSVDGGLSDNPRPALYEAEYGVICANRAGEPATEVVTVVGKHCETDTLFRNVLLPPLQPGDILAVQSTGAYNYAMASNYNRFPRPAMVLVNEGCAEVIVRRETYEDLLRCDLIPARLR
ncbi:MAG: diaminopimelate decarboxylase [Armatimonadetes bacterium CG_4_10_14_3_um_filter_66_18]|nr:diaminopimelate decarboxylase [Armatimonadota bacterium]OIO95216.1 MAG: diaminopimelate decarboxylase [Armatimonadetes bacterium CG2_30_66_41]PIU89685.1 MAG: diaminopimelate decarboxylase [Armatimonadetes bacterium CG06_land_8_20_14_3_00_66_21]PIW13150.1 MAG: diaminopimelate decarboxylase [Armatimonadetes bacterium CG17_big_fil_post_rev_8_21_14_2_50_66_6]PIX49568.1 MAG: diaminopimelate decarboxylase [Armatimonadetes bacterium CG_4_8_14_3_um_filter_66_20]PIY53152.1 MAG: diaminopimelate decar